MKRFLNDCFFRSITNVKNTWNGIESLTKTNSSIRRQNSSLLSNNILISEPGQRPEIFNEYFSSIADKLQNKIKLAAKNFSWYLRKANLFNSFNVTKPLTEIKLRHREINGVTGVHIQIGEFEGKIELHVIPKVNFSLIWVFRLTYLFLRQNQEPLIARNFQKDGALGRLKIQ